MKRRWMWLGVAVLMAIAIGLTNAGDTHFLTAHSSRGSSVFAQPAPSPAPQPTPEAATIPKIPVSISPTPPALPSAPPASTASPLPIATTYQDPAGQFKVGVLQGFSVNPLAGSVLVESRDGSLAYTVVVQAQPTGTPIGLGAGIASDGLAKVATTVFQKGERFQPGFAQPEAGGGVVMNWTGSLTIAGKAQPIGGIVLVRPSTQHILLLLIAATEAGSAQVPGAVSALANSLQSL